MSETRVSAAESVSECRAQGSGYKKRHTHPSPGKRLLCWRLLGLAFSRQEPQQLVSAAPGAKAGARRARPRARCGGGACKPLGVRDHERAVYSTAALKFDVDVDVDATDIRWNRANRSDRKYQFFSATSLINLILHDPVFRFPISLKDSIHTCKYHKLCSA